MSKTDKNKGNSSFSVVSANAESAEGYDKDFMGEHFEGLGNVWHALFDDDDSIVQYLPTIITQGKLHDDCQRVYQDGTFVALLHYPSDQVDICAGVLIDKAPDSNNMVFKSCFPIMKGIPNSLYIKKSHTWENGIEGVVAAERVGDGPPVSFFAPFYFRDFDSFVPNVEKTVHLAALAFSCEKAELKEFTVDKGGFFEMQLQEFVDNNPGKTAKEFSAPVVSMRGSRILLQSKYTCEWEYRCPVLNVERASFFEKLIYKLHVVFVGIEDEELAGYLYVPAHMLNGYIPQIGDDIQGVLWMTGVLDK